MRQLQKYLTFREKYTNDKFNYKNAELVNYICDTETIFLKIRWHEIVTDLREKFSLKCSQKIVCFRENIRTNIWTTGADVRCSARINELFLHKFELFTFTFAKTKYRHSLQI